MFPISPLREKALRWKMKESLPPDFQGPILHEARNCYDCKIGNQCIAQIKGYSITDPVQNKKMDQHIFIRHA